MRYGKKRVLPRGRIRKRYVEEGAGLGQERAPQKSAPTERFSAGGGRSGRVERDRLRLVTGLHEANDVARLESDFGGLERVSVTATDESYDVQSATPWGRRSQRSGCCASRNWWRIVGCVAGTAPHGESKKKPAKLPPHPRWLSGRG